MSEVIYVLCVKRINEKKYKFVLKADDIPYNQVNLVLQFYPDLTITDIYINRNDDGGYTFTRIINNRHKKIAIINEVKLA